MAQSSARAGQRRLGTNGTGFGDLTYSLGAVKLPFEKMMQRSFFTAIVVIAAEASLTPHLAALTPNDAPDYAVRSPSGEIALHLHAKRDGPLQYDVTFGTHPIIERSRLGIVVDGVNLAAAARIERVERYDINEKYPTRGVHSVAVNHCTGAKFWIASSDTGTRLALDVRAFDDGLAFRHIARGGGPRPPDAAIVFTIPGGSVVGPHAPHNHYEGTHIRDPFDSISAAQWIAPPLTFQLPDH